MRTVSGLISSVIFTFIFYSSGVIADSLISYKQAVDSAASQVESAKQKLLDESNALSLVKSRSDNLNREYESVKKEYQELVSFDAENPGAVNFEKLSAKRTENSKAYLAYKDSLSNVIEAEAKLAGSVRALRQSEDDLDSSISALKSAGIDEVERRVNQQKSAFERQQVVEVALDYFCTENETFKTCRQTAIKKADREAIEKGAVVTISSTTEMRNFKITSDVTKSEVNGKIIDRQNVSLSPVMGGEYGGMHYEMLATVQAYLPDSMLQSFRNNIALEVYGRHINYFSQHDQTDVISSNDDYLAQIEREYQARLAETKRLEEQERAQAEEERRLVEDQRQQAEFKAEQELRYKKQEEQRLKRKIRAPAIIF
jgi:hypothetical protein